MLNDTQIFPSVPASLTGQSLVSHAGLNVLTSFLDATGFGSLCEDRFSQFVPAQAMHRPGRIIGSLAVMLAGGGEHVSDLDVLRNSPGLFGPVPSNATVSRFVARAADQPEAFAHGFTTLSRRLRSRIWQAAGTTESRRAGHPVGSSGDRHRCDPGDRTFREGKHRRHLQGRVRIRAHGREHRLRLGERDRGDPGRDAAPGKQGRQ